ncbi:MAG: bifunctional methylenetetrahydrofolate dehydrogenase/methenyltetrahydrofolate cyclohydrolase FolD [Firmicutes bacterium]|nr:bifunctional methylenetetrahydrofolate dehydrogenase/methenyltetrahydrofolate cyclohydrolase FolD [Bacillota bacterium]
METTIISGTQLAKQIRKEVRAEVSVLTESGKRLPKLAVVLVGEDPASQVYVRNKNNACEKVGLLHETIVLPWDTSMDQLLNVIDGLNKDEAVDGILVQMPLPNGLNEEIVKQAVRVDKDVDGFHVENAGKVSLGKFDEAFVPCTPMGVVELLKRNGIEIAGKHVVIVGRSNLVGKPEALLMLSEDATVTVCHSKTPDLSAMTKQADILISAVGRKHTIHADMIKEGCVVVDVGINRTETGICGDVDFDECLGKASAMTPVPGGVGPMTIAMLLKNTMKAYRLHEKL